MAKELFNQPLKTTLGSTDRVALGVPGQDGCDNMLITKLIELILADNVETGTIQNGDLSSGVWTYTHNKSTAAVELILYDGNGVLQSVDGIMTLTTINELEIDFGGSISGTWTYIFRWYYL